MTTLNVLSGVSLAAVTATGAGTQLLWGTPMTAASMQVATTGSPTSYSINLEGSIDGTTFFTLANVTQATTGLNASSINVAVFIAIRANLVSFSGGTSPTFTATIAVA